MMTTDIQELAEQAAGNWTKFDCFCWFDRPDDAGQFAIYYTHHRDSDSISRANAASIAEILAPFIESGDVIPQTHSHWAVGRIEGFAIRVLRDEEPTDAFRAWLEIQGRLEDYPVLDESKLSETELEDEEQAWDSWGSYEFKRELAERWGCEIDLTADQLSELFYTLLERSGEYWEHHSDGPHIDLERIVDAMTADDADKYGIK